jgi:hypothetical protein
MVLSLTYLHPAGNSIGLVAGVDGKPKQEAGGIADGGWEFPLWLFLLDSRI